MSVKTILTKYFEYCMICGRPAELHHIFKGNKQRKLADQDLLIMPLCPEHHRGNMSVHMKRELNVLSEMCGQLAWERKYLADKLAECEELGHQCADDWMDESREAFRKRYGESYL